MRRAPVIGEPGVGDGNGAIRLAVDMRQDDAIGIDHPVPLGIGSTDQGLGKRREGMQTS